MIQPSAIGAAFLYLCLSCGISHAQWYVERCSNQWGTSKKPDLTPAYSGPPSPSFPAYNSGEVQFKSQFQPPSHIMNGASAATARICAYYPSQALAAYTKLTDGTTGGFFIQEGNCADVSLAALDVGPYCWWQGRCPSYKVQQTCFSEGTYVDSYSSYGFIYMPLIPAADVTMHRLVPFNFKGASTHRNFFILSSEVTRTVSICTDQIGTTIYYDQTDPFGKKNPSL